MPRLSCEINTSVSIGVDIEQEGVEGDTFGYFDGFVEITVESFDGYNVGYGEGYDVGSLVRANVHCVHDNSSEILQLGVSVTNSDLDVMLALLLLNPIYFALVIKALDDISSNEIMCLLIRIFHKIELLYVKVIPNV